MLNSSQETSPKDAHPELGNATPVAITSQTQVTPANSGSQCLPPGLPPLRPRSVIEGDAHTHTHTNSFGPNFSLAPSNQSRIRGHRTEAVSNTYSTTLATTIHNPSNAGHTGTVPSTPSPLLPISVLEDSIPTYSQSTPTFSMSRSDDSPSRMGSLEANNFTTVLPPRQQAEQFVTAMIPILSPPLRDTRPYPGGKDGSGRPRTTPTC